LPCIDQRDGEPDLQMHRPTLETSWSATILVALQSGRDARAPRCMNAMRLDGAVSLYNLLRQHIEQE